MSQPKDNIKGKRPSGNGLFDDFYMTVLPWMIELAVLKGTSKQELYEFVDSAVNRVGEDKPK